MAGMMKRMRKDTVLLLKLKSCRTLYSLSNARWPGLYTFKHVATPDRVCSPNADLRPFPALLVWGYSVYPR